MQQLQLSQQRSAAVLEQRSLLQQQQQQQRIGVERKLKPNNSESREQGAGSREIIVGYRRSEGIGTDEAEEEEATTTLAAAGACRSARASWQGQERPADAPCPPHLTATHAPPPARQPCP